MLDSKCLSKIECSSILAEEIRYTRSSLFAAARLTELSISFERNLKIIDGKDKDLYGVNRDLVS